jgi:hypothetical protein
MPKPLLSRGSESAPSFKGKATHLEHYFSNVVDVREEPERTTNADKIHIALCYLDIEEEQLWSGKATAGMTFNEFKTEIKKLYPGLDGEKLHTWMDLRDVIRISQQKPPSSREDFRVYQRNFLRTADFLKTKGKISDREVDENFMWGIHPDFRLQVLQRLLIVKHDQPSDIPYAMKDVVEAVEWAINGAPGALYKEMDEETITIKKEMFNLTSSMKDMGHTFSQEVQTLYRAIKKVTNRPQENSPY